jgi:hypothetical protein
MSKAVKIKIYKMMGKPVVVYESQTRLKTEMDVKRLNTWDREILRRIYGPVVEKRMWRIRTNPELRELYKYLDTAAGIKKQRLEWIVHLVGMDNGRVVKKIFKIKPQGRIRMRRPRLRWLEDGEKDL